MAENHCQGCSECCRLLEVREIQKPALTTCAHQVRSGCAIYADRPDACRAFMCIWLYSRVHRPPGDRLPEAMRPDRSHVVLGPRNWREGGDVLYVHVDPDYPEAWRQGPVRDYLRGLAARGQKLVIFVGDEQVRIGAGGAVGFRGTEEEFARLAG